MNDESAVNMVKRRYHIHIHIQWLVNIWQAKIISYGLKKFLYGIIGLILKLKLGQTLDIFF